MTKHDDWMNKHFSVTDPPKIIRPDPEETDRGRRFWFFLSLLFIAPVTAVGIAWYLGYLDPVIREVFVDRKVVEAPTTPNQERPPNVNITYSAQRKQEPEADPVKSITRARANELQRLITSRESAIDLMIRDRSEALDKQTRSGSFTWRRMSWLNMGGVLGM